MNKYEFIADLLDKEKLDPSQKERVINLIIKELKSDGINQIEIEKRVAQIEQQLKSKANIEHEEMARDRLYQHKGPLAYKDPTQLSQFLRAYNQDILLKYTCHSIDFDGLNAINNKCGAKIFSLEKYQDSLHTAFKKLSNSYKISKNIWSLINTYLNGGKEWSSDNVEINWKSPKLFEWCRENPGVVPNPGEDIITQTQNIGFEFKGFKSKIFTTQVRNFSELVIYFKNLFHIRSDNSLKRLVENINNLNEWDSRINFSLSDMRVNIEFFTDVDKLLQAYKKIITIILDISNKHNLTVPEVKVSLKENNNVIIFSIHHFNSIYKKTMKNTLERIGQSHTDLINNQINGVCDLNILADFGNLEFAKINLWDGKDRLSEYLDDFKGVEYQLIFK